MNIYHLSRGNGYVDYDEYDAFVVVAPSEEEARKITEAKAQYADPEGVWTDTERSSCRLIGRARSDVAVGVMLGSFNAG